MARGNRAKRIGKWAGYAALALVAVVILLAFNLVGRTNRALPDYAGEAALPGLEAPVEIIRDRFAIPHIFADNRCDMSYALGYVHAQERLWQMEMYRRLAQGRLAELFGPPAVEADRILRTVGLYRAAEAALPHLSDDVNRCLESYADGVNAWLATKDRPLPPEFQILWHEPEPWHPADSVAVVKILAALSGNAFTELVRPRIMEVLDEEQYRQFDTDYPASGPYGPVEISALMENSPLRALAEAWPDLGPPAASNNWVVDGRWTASGKPLLANDPHLSMTAPSIWYAAHIKSPEIEAIGVTIPGIPSVILGHNTHIAWGYTTTGADVQDLYIEKIDPASRGRYMTEDGPREFETHEETIIVRFGSDRTFTVRETRHGPVLDLPEGMMEDPLQEGYVMALRWTALDDDDTTIEAGLRILEAETVADFDNAVRLHIAPMQSMVVADTQGGIGMIAPARVPVRGPAHETGGLMPAPGWKAENQWQGSIPHEDLPRNDGSETGYALTANNKIISDDYPYYLSDSWESPYRAQRVEQLLTARRSHDIASFETMLADNRSGYAEALLPHLLTIAPETDRQAVALALLQDWDAGMDAGIPQPAIFHAWLRRMPEHLFADELGDLAGSASRRKEQFTLNVLADKDGMSKWCDDVSTPDTETCADIMRAALTDGLDDLDRLTGRPLADIRWGDLHPVANGHMPFRFVPGLAGLFGIERPSAGGPYTINRGQTGGGEARPFANVHAAGYRAVFDLADLEKSVFIISTGQSGNPASDHWEDMADLWAEGAHIPMLTDRQRIEAGMIGHLTLNPAP